MSGEKTHAEMPCQYCEAVKPLPPTLTNMKGHGCPVGSLTSSRPFGQVRKSF